MNAELKIVLRNASKVAKRYKRKCWWSDEEDLRQEASLHQLKAVPHYDVEKAQGVPLEGYLWRVAVFSARRLLLKSSAPVSASHRLDVLIGLQRTPLTPDLAWRPERSDVDYSGRQVQDRVVECLGKGGAEFAFAVFVAGWKAEEIAEANGESKTEAQRVMRTTYNMLAADKHLHTMWREL